MATYIQSGNVPLTSTESGRVELIRRIEVALARAFSYRAHIVLRSRREMRDIVRHAPDGFGLARPGTVTTSIFLGACVTAPMAMKSVLTRRAWTSARRERRALLLTAHQQGVVERSRRLVSLPVYQSMTIRNWNTTTTLLRLMDGRGSD